jgi:hypothetical protein
MTFQPQVSLLLVMSQERKTQRYICFWLADFLVMLYYDYFLTLHREIQFLWPPHNKQRPFTLACIINRYVPMIGVLPVVMSYFIRVNPAVRPSS